MNYSEKYGNDVDEAVELALKDLKLTRDEVIITILEEPSKGFLGLGSKLAKVRVEPKADNKKTEEKEPEQKPCEEQHEQAKEKAPSRSREKRSSERHASDSRKSEERRASESRKTYEEKSTEERPNRRSIATARPDDLEPVAEDDEALMFLRDITEQMGLELSVTASKDEEYLYADIEGKDAGTIIGKRGQTLDAIQYLTSLVVNRGKEGYIRVVVDAENYRAKRERTLEQLAARLADKAVKTRRSVRLEPMNPYERMVIHATLQNDDRVATRSEGDEPYRRVIIELK